MRVQVGVHKQMKVIPLTKGQVAFVSDHRFEELNRYVWRATLSGEDLFYAARDIGGARGKSISMHQQILGSNGGDHHDMNGLNNCDYNLRPANKSQNAANQRKQTGCSSQYKGVCLAQLTGKWIAHIKVNQRCIHLGCFKYEENAGRAYDAAAVEY